MAKGGRREGAGRPRGSRGKRTREAVAKAEALGPTPLEVLLELMHAARAEGERAEAVACAKANDVSISYVNDDSCFVFKYDKGQVLSRVTAMPRRNPEASTRHIRLDPNTPISSPVGR